MRFGFIAFLDWVVERGDFRLFVTAQGPSVVSVPPLSLLLMFSPFHKFLCSYHGDYSPSCCYLGLGNNQKLNFCIDLFTADASIRTSSTACQILLFSLMLTTRSLSVETAPHPAAVPFTAAPK